MKNSYENLIGKKVVQAVVGKHEGSDNLDFVKLILDEGVARFNLFGDCCSVSYFTDPKNQFGELIGATILNVEERYNDIAPADPELNDDQVSWHFLVFTTNRGHITVDWRNDSNGYYDGWVNFEFVDEQSQP